jgi:hypothetical protein
VDIDRVRRLLAGGESVLSFADHAIIEARKDGLTTEDLENTITKGERIEDYGVRALFCGYPEDDRLPCHAVLECGPGVEEAVIVTAYTPDAKEWESNWKKRKRRKRR